MSLLAAMDVGNVETIYAIGTLLIWIGWGSAIVAVFRLVSSLLQPMGLPKSQALRGAAFAAATAAACLVLAAGLPMTSDVKSTARINFPVIWIVMPFTAWASSACVAFALHRAYSLIVSGGGTLIRTQEDQRRAWMRQLITAVIAAALFLYLFKHSGDPANVIRGAIPMSLSTVGWLAVLAIATTSLMAIWGRQAKTRGLAKTVVSHVALLIGSVVFGLPFAWLVITSFKEDQDMSSANGLVWIPRVSVTVPYRNPQDPLYEGSYKGQTVQARVIDKEPDGRIRLDISKPMALRGATFDAMPSELKQIDEQIPVVTATYKGKAITGDVIKELEDGSKKVQITQPAELSGQVFQGPASDFEAVRHVGLKFSNYPDSLEYLPPEAHMGLTYLKNTLLIVLLSVIGTLISCSIVAYAFGRLQFPSKKLLFAVLLSTMMLPAAVTLLPTFLIFKYLGWIDTLYPLWVPAFFAGAFNVFLLRQFFMTVPKELEDASKIDGCSYFGTFWKVMLPQVKPALAVIAIWTFMGVWNNFMGPLVYINSPENMPVAYAVQLYQGQRGGEPGLLMAFATMAMLPVLALFFFAQRYFIEGVTLSGLGGR